MRRALHGHHPRGVEVGPREVAGRRADPEGDPPRPRRLRHRAGPREEGPLGRGAQPLQAAGARLEAQRRRAREVQHHADRADGLGQDAARADARPHPRRALHDGRRDDANRSRLRRRGRREHHPEAAPGVRLQRRAGAARHRVHRRDRQDLAQVRQPVDHPGRVGRGRAAGPAQDHGRHGRVRAAAGRPQAPAAGVPAGRHDEHPVHLRRRVRGAGPDHLPAGQGHVDRLRRRTTGGPARSSATSSRRTCSSSA
jgi:hypothetical protein